jgi:predicted AAA+ superfamily ATPase
MKNYILRYDYIDKIKPYIDKQIIKVIVGQRRVGKSYFLFQVMDIIKKVNSKANIIYVDKESFEFDSLKDYKDLIKYVNKKIRKNKKTYLLIDEIQDINQYEKALRNWNNNHDFDIYCTGSNAKMLSGELSTYLSGRYVEIKLYSLSYLEFLEFHNLENSKETFFSYIKYGGLPFLKNIELSDSIVFNYLKNVYNTILYKDIISRYQIRNVTFLENLVKFLADNVGSLLSAKKISDFLKSQNISISPNIVLDYLSYLTSSYFIFKVKRSEVGGKKIFQIGEKYYFEDLGLRHTIIGYNIKDINKVLENLVYLHFISIGFNVTVGKLKNKEIDFICVKENKTIYVQVAYLITEESTITREFGNLLDIQDNYPKIVISMDDILHTNYKGIEHLNILEFLTNFK